MKRNWWSQGIVGTGIITLLCSLVVGPAFATDADEVADLLSFERATYRLSRNSVINLSSFGLFDTAYDHANRVDQVGRVSVDGLAWDLGRAPSGDRSSIVYTGLGNIADVNHFQLGKVRPWGRGVFAGFLGYDQWKDQASSGSEGSTDSRWTSDMNGINAKFFYGWQGEKLDWGVGLKYLDGEESQTSSNAFSGQDERTSESSRIQIKGAVGNHSSADFGWSTFGWVGQGDARYKDVDDETSYFDEFQRELYDIDLTSFGLGTRLNWYKGKNQYELKMLYMGKMGDLNNRLTYFEEDDGDRYEENVTADTIDTSTFKVSARWYNHLSPKVTFAAGLGVRFWEDDVRLSGNWNDDDSSDGTFSSGITREGLDLTLPTSAMFRLNEKWTAVVGAQFSWNDREDTNRYGFSYMGGSEFNSFYRNDATHTDTDYSAALHYQHSDSLTFQAGVDSGGSGSTGGHDLDVTEWTTMLSLSF